MANTFALQIRIISPVSGHPMRLAYIFIICYKGMLDQTYTSAADLKLRYVLREIEPRKILQTGSMPKKKKIGNVR
jgi:hypothetical protein